MRPLRLEVEGLRSYRQRQEIDFRNRNLVAIVGNTGAGKSSILEAMTYALYNASTWDERSVAALISDGEAKMEVVFEFEAGGRAWRVERATCRDNYPPSRHKLTCLDDPNEPPLNQEGAIKTAIERLLGLKYEAFKSAILLPQGEFETLLKGREVFRTGILKAVFRLDLQIDAVRKGAADATSRLEQQLEVMTVKRHVLFPDPAATAREAKERREEGAAELKRLKGLAARHTELTTSAQAAENEVLTLDQRRERLSELLTGEAEVLAALVPVLGEIEARRVAIQADERTASKEEEALIASSEAADRRGEGLADLKAAEATLRGMKAALPELSADDKHIASEDQAIGVEAHSLAGAEKVGREFADKVSKLEGKHKEAADAVAEAVSLHSDAKAALTAAREAAKEATAAEGELETARRDLAAQEREAKKAELAHKRATTELESADAARRDADRADAASRAAKGLGVGDPCPVCVRPLPAKFTAPRSSGDAAERRYEEAKADAAAAQAALADAGAGLKAAKRSLSEKEKVATRRRQTAAEFLAALKKLLTGADIAQNDSVNLAPVVAAGKELRDAEVKAQKALKAARKEADTHEGSLAPRRAALEDRRKKLSAARKALDDRRRTLEQQRRGLPQRYRPASSATTEDVDATLSQLAGQLEVLRDTDERRATAAKKKKAAQTALTRLAEEQATKVTRRDQHAWPKLLILADRAAEGVPDPTTLPLPTPSNLESLGERAQWARRLETAVREQVVDLERLRSDAAQKASAANQECGQLLANGGYESRELLDDSIVRVSGVVQAATTEEEKATAEIPLARELDRRIGPAEELKAALIALTALLSDGKFVKFVVERRQRILLAVASTILKTMTRNRYAFADNFKIVDLLTNQARPVETLSGGETFLASLALALGLVELAGRAGGRVDSLILDEGFASLDTGALPFALDELARRAGSGKFVALVSHLGAVADAAPDVLYVLQEDGSSTVRWRNEAEDDPLLDAIDARLHRAS